jgi:hypothetical protein
MFIKPSRFELGLALCCMRSLANWFFNDLTTNLSHPKVLFLFHSNSYSFSLLFIFFFLFFYINLAPYVFFHRGPRVDVWVEIRRRKI